MPVAPAVALPTGVRTDGAAAGAPQGGTGLQAVVLCGGTDLAAAALHEGSDPQAVARQGETGLQAEVQGVRIREQAEALQGETQTRTAGPLLPEGAAGEPRQWPSHRRPLASLQQHSRT